MNDKEEKDDQVYRYDRQKFSNIWAMDIRRANLFYQEQEIPEFIRTVISVKRTLFRPERIKVEAFLQGKPVPKFRTDRVEYYWQLLEFIIDTLYEAGYLKYEKPPDGIETNVEAKQNVRRQE